VIGEIIGNFQIVAQIGSGGMGDVFLAEHREIHTKAGIKILHANISTDRRQVDRFFNEAVAVSKIKHAGIIHISDCGYMSTGSAYLIMEYLDGETLAARIQKAGRLTLGDVADIGRQIASVLAATHAVGIIHRDLKPDNIYLVVDAEMARGERVKILDFGIAKLANTNLTGTGNNNSMGTPAYMAPEQWGESSTVDWRADAYSLGCLVFEMCCGRPPFIATSIGEACAMHLTQPPPHARELVPDIPPPLDELLDRMLAKSPDDRPRSMGEIAAGFSQFADSPTGSLYAVATVPISGRGSQASIQHAPTMPTGPGMAAQPAFLATQAQGHQITSEPAKRGGRGALLAIAGLLIGGGAAAAVFVGMHGGKPTPKKDHPVAAPSDAAVVVAPAVVDAGVGSADHPPSLTNDWVTIARPAKPVALGVGADATDTDRGFRPARKIFSPATAYEIQAHEVTYSELDPYLDAEGKTIVYPGWAQDRVKRAKLPATNVTWQLAHDYCESLEAELPTDEEWELAARGPERRPYSWGSDRLDRQLTHTNVGEGGAPDPVMTSTQDKTPGRPIYDLVGNVQEWTEGLWRDDTPSQKPEDEAWVEDGDTTFRAIRGIPMHGAPTARIQPEAAAFREPACATGDCKGKDVPDLDSIGFRCVKNAKTKANHRPGPGPQPPKLDAGVIASAQPDAGTDDCTLESCQDNAMAGACCAKKFPRKPPPLPDEPSEQDLAAAFARLAPAVEACGTGTRAHGRRLVRLHFEPDGHVSRVDTPTTPSAEMSACIKTAGMAISTTKSRLGKVAEQGLLIHPEVLPIDPRIPRR
jgi:serine/threonine-protein kinase